MDAKELIKFLKLLKNCGCLNGYWKSRIDQIIQQLGGQF